mmetsp:Transcript_38300/g.56994  ORF Transcript_38300/g.56994 Transcript_38300/m.56994 type:complete len:81 (+) Transcript_38300:130-372(+)
MDEFARKRHGREYFCLYGPMRCNHILKSGCGGPTIFSTSLLIDYQVQYSIRSFVTTKQNTAESVEEKRYLIFGNQNQSTI